MAKVISRGTLRKSVNYSIADGSFYSVMFGFGDSYISPYAIALRASTRAIGLLTSLPMFIASVSQYMSPYLTQKIGRKKPCFYLPFCKD